MRLTCPNCDAQYEVPDAVIPAEGRDVQCSDCGHTWYQDHPDHADAPAGASMRASLAQPATGWDEDEDDGYDPAEAAEYTEADHGPEAEDQPEPAPQPQPQPQRRLGLDDLPDLDPAAMDRLRRAPPPPVPDDPEDLDAEDDDPDDRPVTAAAAPRPRGTPRELDPAISDILRQEAERENRLRQAEAQTGLESQPELGLDAPIEEDGPRRAREARERMARLRGDSPRPDTVMTGGGRARKSLPDIEEINSSLRPGEMAAGPTAPARPVPARKSGGFARGFSVAVILAVALTLVYSKAQPIARAVPQADPVINAYVAMVDQGRIWLHSKLNALLPPPPDQSGS